jgi:hypothetical protein
LRRARNVLAATVAVLAAAPAAAPAAPGPASAPAEVAVEAAAGEPAGRAIPRHFAGFSIEWSLVERYMNPAARPAFANLLRNLGSGILRIGGASQDLMPFDPAAPNTICVITPEDVARVRATVDAVHRGAGPRRRTPSWGVELGTAMAPVSDRRPFISPEHTRRFVDEGVLPVFGGRAARDLAAVGLANEPDLTYGADGLEDYLRDLALYGGDAVSGPVPVSAPNTSEDIVPWTELHATRKRWFADWPRILDTAGPVMRRRAGAFAPYGTDHFYPLARTCEDAPYRCPSIPALLSPERMQTLDYQVHRHASVAAERGLGYRLGETNTAAGRGAPGVSDVAAAATYTLDMLFHAACPQPPDQPGANADCRLGAVGVNLHNAEVEEFWQPEDGNAYYNAIRYDPADATGAPKAAPPYYALLLFAELAQGADGLRPLAAGGGAGAPDVSAWQVDDGPERRVFLVNKTDRPVGVDVRLGTPLAWVHRLTPHDPAGAGRTLDAPEVRLDGRAVAADGTWPGLRPRVERARRGRLRVELAPGEAAAVRTGRAGGG